MSNTVMLQRVVHDLDTRMGYIRSGVTLGDRDIAMLHAHKVFSSAMAVNEVIKHDLGKDRLITPVQRAGLDGAKGTLVYANDHLLGLLRKDRLDATEALTWVHTMDVAVGCIRVVRDEMEELWTRN